MRAWTLTCGRLIMRREMGKWTPKRMLSRFTKHNLNSMPRLSYPIISLEFNSLNLPTSSCKILNGVINRKFSTNETDNTPGVCPQCSDKNTYWDGSDLFICCSCGHEWASTSDNTDSGENKETVTRDAHGTIIIPGNTVLTIKELKAGPKVIKKGTKLVKIQIGDFGDNHDISCKIPGGGTFLIKSQFVKKTN